MFFTRKISEKHLCGYRNDLYRLALSWCSDQMIADDLTQETLTKAITKYDQLKDQKKLKPWLFKILNNCWNDYLRKHHPTLDIDEQTLVFDETPEKKMQQKQQIDLVRSAVNSLPVSQRQIVTLVDIQSLSYAEVAEILEIPIGTVMSRISRARQLLKKALLLRDKNLEGKSTFLRRVK